MFCPLCKAEYRDGFSRCNDCETNLVASKSEAESTAVKVIYRGPDLRRFDEIVGALRDARIPCNAKSTADPEKVLSATAAFGFSQLLDRIFPFGKLEKRARQASRIDWEVRVLAQQQSAAKAVMGRAGLK
jgi:hypothetical protein